MVGVLVLKHTCWDTSWSSGGSLTRRCAALVLKVVLIFLFPSLGSPVSDCGEPGLTSCSHSATVCLLPALQGFCHSHPSLWDLYFVVILQETLRWEDRKDGEWGERGKRGEQGELGERRAGHACTACKAWNQNWDGEDRKGERGRWLVWAGIARQARDQAAMLRPLHSLQNVHETLTFPHLVSKALSSPVRYFTEITRLGSPASITLLKEVGAEWPKPHVAK